MSGFYDSNLLISWNGQERGHSCIPGRKSPYIRIAFDGSSIEGFVRIEESDMI